MQHGSFVVCWPMAVLLLALVVASFWAEFSSSVRSYVGKLFVGRFRPSLPGDVPVGDDERVRDGVGVLCCW